MATTAKTLIDLETQFWQSMVDQDTDVALKLMHEPSMMASSHGAMQFGHADYRKMAEQGPQVVTAFAISDAQVLFANETTAVLTYRVKQTVAARDGSHPLTQEMCDTSTWVHSGKGWQCILHTETPMESKPPKQ